MARSEPRPNREDAAGGATAPSPGVHLSEWAAELVGSALLLFVVVSAVTVDFGPGSQLVQIVPSRSLRLLITGLVIAGSASLYAITPPGKRSGAHLNPVVTLAFWLMGHVHRHDLLGYWVSQLTGALIGTAAGMATWREAAFSVHVAATRPGQGMPLVVVVGAEFGMTATLVLVIFFLLARPATERLVPLVAWLLVAGFVWQLAPVSGTSLNPARSFGPALFDGNLQWMWIYLVGPGLGAVAAAGLAHLWDEGFNPLTAKLFRDPKYKNVFGTRAR